MVLHDLWGRLLGSLCSEICLAKNKHPDTLAPSKTTTPFHLRIKRALSLWLGWRWVEVKSETPATSGWLWVSWHVWGWTSLPCCVSVPHSKVSIKGHQDCVQAALCYPEGLGYLGCDQASEHKQVVVSLELATGIWNVETNSKVVLDLVLTVLVAVSILALWSLLPPPSIWVPFYWTWKQHLKKNDN